MKAETWKIIAVLAIGTLVLSYLGYINLKRAEVGDGGGGGGGGGDGGGDGGGTTYDAAALRWTMSNIITGASLGTAATGYVDISKVVDGVWDPLKTSEQREFDADPDTSVLEYNYGDTLIFHVTSDADQTSGAENYDRWFYAILGPGNAIRELTPAILTASQTSPSYKYTITGQGLETGWQVSYVAGTTPYWGLGAFELYPRISAANLDMFLSYGGTTLSSVTDGSSWDDTTAEINANATLASDNENFYVKLLGGANDFAFGLPQYVLAQSGKLEEYRTVIIMATSGTSIGISALTADGFNPVNKVDVTADAIFYRVIDPLIPTRGTKFDVNYEMTLDASSLTASTQYRIGIWIMDIQLPSNVAIGATSTAIPTVYGMMKEMGPDAIIQAVGLTVSSGAVTGATTATTEQLYALYTTAA